MGTSTKYEAQPRSHHYEFLGPPGAFFITLTVPIFTYLFAIFCNEGGCPARPLDKFLANDFWRIATEANYVDLKAWGVYAAWYAWTVLCWAILPGEWYEGVLLRDGKTKLQYKINAFSTFIATLLLASGIYLWQGHQPFLFIYEHWFGLATAALLNSILQASYVYLMSFTSKDEMLALGGNTGSVIYDFFIGRSLNPRIGSFDIKSFNELRPGLILWFILDLGMVAKQYHDNGRVTDSLWIVVVNQGLYVADAMWNEKAIFTTMDITTDGFGFMLSVGDLLWVPFTYGLQTRFLALHPIDLGFTLSLCILAVNFLGYYIFRKANGQKNDFRNGKIGNLQYMTTEKGSKLITSGWWGRSRHPNYMGDLIMGLAWSLPTGFENPLTYFYFVYFLVLLVHRQRRDDENCKKKYGKDWDIYCKKVPSRIFPGIY
ncbi:ERG4/ERG24 ergosterol biosynthesis protein [Atractiella rhizophila]|nr:ERG4/ERG24 ergosterol biosynthesis protein [Atractiella rhizophila]